MGQIIWYEDLEKALNNEQISKKMYEVFSCLKKLGENSTFQNSTDGIKTKYIKYLFVLLALKKPFRRVYANRIMIEERDKVPDKDILSTLKSVTNIEDTEYAKICHIGSVEWQFDVHWYLDEGDNDQIQLNNVYKTENPESNFCPKSFPLAVESEWGSRNQVKYDFQKLLFCNAEERLIIFEALSEEKFKDLEKYFKRSIKLYCGNDFDGIFQFVAITGGNKKREIKFGTYSEI